MDNWSDKGAICPHCKHVALPDDDNYSLFSEDTCEWTCSGCGKEFAVEVFTRYSWMTEAIDTGCSPKQGDQS